MRMEPENKIIYIKKGQARLGRPTARASSVAAMPPSFLIRKEEYKWFSRKNGTHFSAPKRRRAGRRKP